MRNILFYVFQIISFMEHRGITSLVNACAEYPFPEYQGVKYVWVPVEDRPHAPLEQHFDNVAEQIQQNHTWSLMVFCSATATAPGWWPPHRVSFLRHVPGSTEQDGLLGIVVLSGLLSSLQKPETQLCSWEAEDASTCAVQDPRTRVSVQIYWCTKTEQLIFGLWPLICWLTL